MIFVHAKFVLVEVLTQLIHNFLVIILALEGKQRDDPSCHVFSYPVSTYYSYKEMVHSRLRVLAIQYPLKI